MSRHPQVSSQRREYSHGTLTQAQLLPCPIAQFESWLQQANDAQLQDATAMTVATVDAIGRPFQRMVLLKAVDEKGFVFFTNLGSRKAQQIQHNANVSLHFAWLTHDRQVIINGRAKALGKAENVAYFLSRPKASQLAAMASRQSRPISARRVLEEKYLELKQKFAQGGIEAPSFWGGFRIEPEQIEFWQGGEHRLHDRFIYQRAEPTQNWSIARYAP
ncbi:MAG: pyridoxamine 5'-phosphate oxidase [Gammaproteobacteria bacterium]|nr:pyridoxamine 5'-phosphate oxidase [Gammaproteobacteria bacterium]